MPQENKNEREEEAHDKELDQNKEMVRTPVSDSFKLRNHAALHALQMSPSDSTSEFMFPQELNDCLRTHINNLTAENGALRRCLDEKENEIQRMRDKSVGGFSRGSVFAGVGRASDLAASKIVELSKRVRELTAELEGERARRRKMLVSMEQSEGREVLSKGGRSLERKKDSAAQKIEEGTDGVEADEVREDEVKALKEKLSAANTKVAEWRNQCQSLKQELKMADKILASEVGDAATIEAAKATIGLQSPTSGGSSAWRGRAQQLTLLRHKVSELQEKLKKAERWRGNKDGEVSAGESEEWRKERERWTNETRRLEASVAEAEKRAEEWKRKAEVSRARAAALRSETEALRVRMSTILAKAEHDDQLISSLSESLKRKESLVQDKESELKAMMSSWEKEKEGMVEELMKEKTKVSHMKDTLTDKDVILEKFEQILKGFNSAADSRKSKPPLPQGTSAAWWNPAPSEQELQAVAQAAEAERLRLIELVAVLNRRLKEERIQAEHSSKALRIERQKNARLETKVARLELELASGRNKAYNRFSYRKNSCDTEKAVIPEEIKYRLEILEEEKLVLESRIERLRQEKEDDLKKYSLMLRETREVFLSKKEQMENSRQNINAQRSNSYH